MPHLSTNYNKKIETYSLGNKPRENETSLSLSL